MKTTSFTLLSIMAVSILCSGCFKNKLGKDSMTATVDGQPFELSNQVLSGASRLTGNGIEGVLILSYNKDYSIGLGIDSAQTGLYAINGGETTILPMSGSNMNTHYGYRGSITVNKIEFEKGGAIDAEFWFDAMYQGDSIIVRNGKLKMYFDN